MTDCLHTTTTIVDDYGFVGPVASGDAENPMAHGCITRVEQCVACGLMHNININQHHREEGDRWYGTTFSAQWDIKVAAREAAERAYRRSQAHRRFHPATLYTDVAPAGGHVAFIERDGIEVVVGAGASRMDALDGAAALTDAEVDKVIHALDAARERAVAA